MNIKRILITGDDGYNSIGTRLLVHYLKDSYDLVVAATRDQMSGVGGHLSLKNGGEWGETTVDGVPALWVSGYPCDAMECAVGYFKKPFDLVISGINWGMNIGGAIISSGTYSAAIRALNLGLAPRGIVMSWMLPPSFWHKRHNGDEVLEKYLEYPGRTAFDVFLLAIRNGLWGAQLLNVNFPSEPSKTIRFTKGVPNLSLFFHYPTPMDKKTHRFAYPMDDPKTRTKNHPEYDTGAILSGNISISPHNIHLLNEGVYKKLKNKIITL